MPGPFGGGGSEYPDSGSDLEVGPIDWPIGEARLGKRGLKDDSQVTQVAGKMKWVRLR